MLSLTARASARPTPALVLARRALTARGNNPKTTPDGGKRTPPPSHGSSTPIDSAPGWNEDLATASEAFVKADRERESTTIKEMQKKTVDHARSHRPDVDSDLEVKQTHATYAREEVGGPLGSAGMGEFEGVVGNDDLGPDDDGQPEPNGRVVNRRVVGKKRTVRERGSGAG